jgi:hypothetical protein
LLQTQIWMIDRLIVIERFVIMGEDWHGTDEDERGGDVMNSGEERLGYEVIWWRWQTHELAVRIHNVQAMARTSRAEQCGYFGRLPTMLTYCITIPSQLRKGGKEGRRKDQSYHGNKPPRFKLFLLAPYECLGEYK